MKIAYLCLCHFDPEFIARSARILTADGDSFFIHVDKKVEVEPFVSACRDIPNVYFVQNRISNNWGGYSAIRATMETINLALKTDTYDRFVVLQGQDYPLFSNDYIHRFFEANADKEFLRAVNVSRSSRKVDYMKCYGFWANDWRKGLGLLFCRGLSIINRTGIKYRKGFFDSKDGKWDVWHGSALFALTRECTEYIFNQYKTNTRFNRFIKHRFPPDEIYIHTLIYNSKFKDNLSDQVIINRSNDPTLLNVTYCEYPKTTVLFTKKSDYDWLKNIGALYVRKVNSSSKELLDEIDKNIL